MAADDLATLLRLAADADGMSRIDFRDPIAAHGSAAVARLEEWLTDPRLAPFAVVTIKAAGLGGAAIEARTALQRARPHVNPSVAGDIDRALAAFPGSTRTTAAKAERGLAGTPASALGVLRGLVQDWRERGSPPQRAIKWRQADWMAAFPEHRDSLGRLPSSLDRDVVRRVAAKAPKDPGEAKFAFLVVKAWGEGDNGYGPFRAGESLDVTSEPGARLMAVAQTLIARGAMAAYERLSDRGDCRIFSLGPAFGTKFLYFCQPDDQRPRALIHDKNVSDWLRDNAGLNLPSTSWSERRYRAYLAQMQSWAEDLGCSPDDIELCMFRSVLGSGNQWNDG
jgi:hypothetical protein